jgi:hypothetical protein
MEVTEVKDGSSGIGLTVPCQKCGEPIHLPCAPAWYGSRRPVMTCGTCIEATNRQRDEETRQATQRARALALAAVRANLPAAIESCGVPPLWRGAAFDSCPDVPAPLQKAVAEWADRPAGMLYLFGPPGAGKTWLAVAALRQVLAAGILPPSACRFISERDFLAAIKATFGNSNAPTSPRSMPMNHPYRVALLLFDDLGASRLTEWALGEIAGLIEYRHANALPTIITANLPPDALATAVDSRILSRIAESRSMLEFPARDLRVSGSLRSALADQGPLWPAEIDDQEAF